MHRYFLHFAYNGSAYHGWQMQKNALSVQYIITESISTLLGIKVNIVGCGRTDTGVHASDYYAHFDLDNLLSKKENENIVFQLNSYLPNSVVIIGLREVKQNAHARFDALSRTYRYYLIQRKDPFFDQFSYYVYGDLDIELMNKAAKVMMTYTDFTSFSKLHSQTKTNKCNITEANWEKENHKLIFTIQADRFLRNMVRAIVGTLLDVGRKKITIPDFRDIIESKNRCDAGYSVPAKALFLHKVTYPEHIWVN